MSFVDFNVDDCGVARVVLDHPSRHNAFSPEMIQELDTIAQRLLHCSQSRIVLLSARGRTFSAGADLSWMKKQMNASRDEQMEQARTLAMMLYHWYIIDKPVIVKIEGNVYGGAIGLVATADTAIALQSVMFSFSETKLGLIPAVISPYVYAKMGMSSARYTLYSSRKYDACSAQQFGLVNEITNLSNIDTRIDTEIELYLECAPGAVSSGKKMVRKMGYPINQRLINETLELLSDRWEDSEAKEGISAFVERRKPQWLMKQI